MADYGQHNRPLARPNNLGAATSQDRNAAFSSIFGAAPSGRAQTMSSGAPQPQYERSQTMTGVPGGVPLRAPPIRPGQERTATMTNAMYAQAHRGPMIQQQAQPQNLPQPVYDRRPMPPQRVEPRQPLSAQYQRAGLVPQRYPPIPVPALSNGSYRTQSLATVPRPPPPQVQSVYNVPAAHTFRQPTYHNHTATTTAQGRVVPERHDERTMSMSTYNRAPEQAQTMSGRVIPGRRESYIPEPQTPDSQRPVDPQLRTMSMATTLAERTVSMASTMTERSVSGSTIGDRTASMVQSPAGSNSLSASSTLVSRRRAPLVYPALLSRVADVFRERIHLSDKEKDGLLYKSAFTGAEAVDLICYIMQTTDRNLALLLGRSLDAQKFFHDVTYDHRLRDSHAEVYQFRESLVDEESDVNGVFTLTTECYSPTCTPDKLCYSIACPKRVDQQNRLNMRPQAMLKREESRMSLHEDEGDEQKLWINTVSKEIADSVSDREKKRQEVIMELMYTERDFVKDLEYLRDFWMKPLRNTPTGRVPIIPEHRREKFVRTVFSNCLEVHSINSGLADAFTRRQQQQPVVRNVGDLLLEYVPLFGPFIKYGSSQLFGKYEYEKEKQSNAVFAKFADETERRKESRKLELNGYLTKPTTRLARYPLFLESILKYTADDNPDKEDIPKAITAIRDVLSKVNVESGKAENTFTLLQLNVQLSWRQGEYVDLKLNEEGRRMLLKGMFKKSPTETTGDIEAYLFDNALLFVRKKTVSKREELKVYKRPIPLGLLVIPQMEELAQRSSKRPSSSTVPGGRVNIPAPKQESGKQQGHPLTFKLLGKNGFELTLYGSSQIMKEKWMKAVEEQKDALHQRSNIFTKTKLNEGFFVNAGMKVNCCVPFDIGVFVTEAKPKDASVRPKRVLDVKTVTQVDVLEQHSILLVLQDKTLYSYSMEALDTEESSLSPKRGRKISGATFFKIGVIDGQHLVCSVKSSTLSATIKVYKPMDSMVNTRKKGGLSRMMAGGQEVLKPHKEFYIPTETYSIHFLRRTLCVGCARGFEIVTLDTLVTQPLLDQADTSLDFVAMKENLKPIHVERMNPNFLLSYSDYSFFVNKHGWRAMPEWKIVWEGSPQAFALFGPYILAFEPTFIEIRHMDTGMLVYILTAKNVRMLHSSNREILYAYEDEYGEDVIASLDFWTRDGANGANLAGSSDKSKPRSPHRSPPPPLR